MNSINPWFVRGGNRTDGLYAGVFSFNNTNGNANAGRSFRVVLKILFLKVFENSQKEQRKIELISKVKT